MRTYTCDGCGNTISEGVTVKRERTAAKTRYHHYCGKACYSRATTNVLAEDVPVYYPTRGDKITVQWSNFREGDETPPRTDTTLAQVQIRNPGLVTREVHKKK